MFRMYDRMLVLIYDQRVLGRDMLPIDETLTNYYWLWVWYYRLWVWYPLIKLQMYD